LRERKRGEKEEKEKVGLGAGAGATLKWMCGARGIGATHASVAPVASAPHIEPRKTAKSQRNCLTVCFGGLQVHVWRRWEGRHTCCHVGWAHQLSGEGATSAETVAPAGGEPHGHVWRPWEGRHTKGLEW
jgi:hypothetical protein